MKLIAEGAYDAVGRRKYLTKAEGLDFLKETASLPTSDAAFCEFLYYSGCRISEALAVSQSDIDNVQGVVRIRSLKKRGRKQIRRIPLPTHLTQRLAETSEGSTDRIWSFSRARAWRLVKPVMVAASILGIHATCKGLRHSFGVRCALANVPLPIIQGWMGDLAFKKSATLAYLSEQ